MTEVRVPALGESVTEATIATWFKKIGDLVAMDEMLCELETDKGELRVRRHTISVQPSQRISFLTTPNDLGRWAWHCHLLFHMDAGMFREVVVS